MKTVCYKTKEPVIYNKGTENEKSCSTFLEYFTENADEHVKRLNKEKPDKLFNGKRIDWDKIDYYYAGEQDYI